VYLQLEVIKRNGLQVIKRNVIDMCSVCRLVGLVQAVPLSVLVPVHPRPATWTTRASVSAEIFPFLVSTRSPHPHRHTH
jgi:hypothetical protein